MNLNNVCCNGLLVLILNNELTQEFTVNAKTCNYKVLAKLVTYVAILLLNNME